MKQIIVIHGGTTFPSHEEYIAHLKSNPLNYERLLAFRDWKSRLPEAFPEDDILLPSMPNRQNASYDEWKIMFEKIIPLLGDTFSLVGHSLGAVFLAKYLHENKLTHPAAQVILIAAPYDDERDEHLGTFKLSTATGIDTNQQSVHFFYSVDDPIVRISEEAKFRQDLPGATFHTFADRGHFNQAELPELVELLKK